MSVDSEGFSSECMLNIGFVGTFIVFVLGIICQNDYILVYSFFLPVLLVMLNKSLKHIKDMWRNVSSRFELYDSYIFLFYLARLGLSEKEVTDFWSYNNEDSFIKDIIGNDNANYRTKMNVYYLFKDIRKLILLILLPIIIVVTFICAIIYDNPFIYMKLILYVLASLYLIIFIIGVIEVLKVKFLFTTRKEKYRKRYDEYIEKEEEKIAKIKKVKEQRARELSAIRYEASITCSHCGRKHYKDEAIHYEKIREYNHIEVEERYNGTRERIPYLIEEYVITYKRNCCGYEYTQEKRLWINKQTGEKEWKS